MVGVYCSTYFPIRKRLKHKIGYYTLVNRYRYRYTYIKSTIIVLIRYEKKWIFVFGFHLLFHITEKKKNISGLH